MRRPHEPYLGVPLAITKTSPTIQLERNLGHHKNLPDILALKQPRQLLRLPHKCYPGETLAIIETSFSIELGCCNPTLREV
jgi:hypothetical protein